MTAVQEALWGGPAPSVPTVAWPAIEALDEKWTRPYRYERADDPVIIRARLVRTALLLDCCTGVLCPFGWSGSHEFPQGRCQRCGVFDFPGVLSDHDHPGSPCPGSMPHLGSSLGVRIRAWQALPDAEQHATRHDWRHWPACTRCSCPRGVHRQQPGHPDRWPWSDPARSRCESCRSCDGWSAPDPWPIGLTPDLRAAWLEQALTEAGLR